MPSNVAPEGQIFVCAACMRTNKDRTNLRGGWDESCMLNSILCYEQKDADGRFVAVEEREKIGLSTMPRKCVCGDVEPSHGNDPKDPTSTACNEDECECIEFKEKI